MPHVTSPFQKATSRSRCCNSHYGLKRAPVKINFCHLGSGGHFASSPPFRVRSTAIFARSNERLDHLGVDEVIVKRGFRLT